MVGRLGGGEGLSTAARTISRALYAHPRGRLGLLLGPAVFWLLVFYVVALVLLFMTSLWHQDVFTAELVRKWTFSNYDKLLTGEGGLWLRVFFRTVGLAAAGSTTSSPRRVTRASGSSSRVLWRRSTRRS